MSKKYELTQAFNIGKSRLVFWYLVSLHGLAVLAVCLAVLELFIKSAILFFILLSLFLYLRQHNSFAGFSIRHSYSRGWELLLPESQWLEIKIFPSTVVSRYFIALHFKGLGQKRQAIIICKDALKYDDYRKLMVELKINALKKDDE